MNAITRIYQPGALRATRSSHVYRSQWSWGTKILLIIIILSAFAVVYLKDLNRRLFIEYQDIAQANQQAQVEWGKLLLEQSTWSAQASVQQIASTRLKMIIPTAKDVVIIPE